VEEEAMATIDFTKLTLKDALDLAVVIEEEAKERYAELSHVMETAGNADAARFFRLMIQVESSHEHRLSNRRQRLFGVEPRTITREMLFEVEAPARSEVFAEMTEREAMNVALRAEQKAYAYFDAALKHVTDWRVREIFAELRADEMEHQRLVERQLERGPSVVATS
jgi:rubrerythrin